MPTTYQPADVEAVQMAKEIIGEFPSHESLIRAKVKVDYIFAFGARNDDGAIIGDAIKKNGCKALGLCRNLGLKDRTMGRGDAEILIDADWWNGAPDEERRALLDHELHHIMVKTNQRGLVKTDDLNRPLLKLRKHDYEFGWFNAIAGRHGIHSQERIQARAMLDTAGQLYWPGLMQGELDVAESAMRRIRGTRQPETAGA